MACQVYDDDHVRTVFVILQWCILVSSCLTKCTYSKGEIVHYSGSNPLKVVVFASTNSVKPSNLADLSGVAGLWLSTFGLVF